MENTLARKLTRTSEVSLGIAYTPLKQQLPTQHMQTINVRTHKMQHTNTPAKTIKPATTFATHKKAKTQTGKTHCPKAKYANRTDAEPNKTELAKHKILDALPRQGTLQGSDATMRNRIQEEQAGKGVS